MTTTKRSHLGKAGDHAVMAELLLRGWNVAIPEVDVGDDIFVVDDNADRAIRVQVKTTEQVARRNGRTDAKFDGSRAPGSGRAPRCPSTTSSCYERARWEFVVLRRSEFQRLRAEAVATPPDESPARKRPGPRPRPTKPDLAKEKGSLSVVFTFTEVDVTALGALASALPQQLERLPRSQRRPRGQRQSTRSEPGSLTSTPPSFSISVRVQFLLSAA